MIEEGRWINYNDTRAASATTRQRKEVEAPASPTTKEKEEPEAPTYWIEKAEDTEVSEETYRCIDVLRQNYPMHWMKLMRHETGFLTDEEALKEMEEEAEEQLVEATQAEKPQERTPPTKNKGAEGARRGRPKQEHKKIERSLTLTRKTRQSKESNVGEPRKKGKKAIEEQTAGAAEQVPVLGKQGQEPVNRAGLSRSAVFARMGLHI